MSKTEIYKITNSVNAKVYIGFTSRRLCDRLDSHRRDAAKKPHLPLYAAINEYGIDRFSIAPIEELPYLAEDTSRREQYWIDYYDSAYPNGYNADYESMKRLRGEPRYWLVKAGTESQ
jgi:group I intron endonuclease